MRENDGEHEEHTGLSVRCLFFAQYAELVGESEIQIDLPRGSTIADAVTLLRDSVPGCKQMPERLLVALNQVHAAHHSRLKNGDELAFLPPLAGG